MRKLVFTLFPILTACTSLEGTTVGAHIPIGGIVNVGVTKKVNTSEKQTKEETEEGCDREDESGDESACNYRQSDGSSP